MAVSMPLLKLKQMFLKVYLESKKEWIRMINFVFLF